MLPAHGQVVPGVIGEDLRFDLPPQRIEFHLTQMLRYLKGFPPADQDPAERLRDEKMVPAFQNPGFAGGDIDWIDDCTGPLGNPDDSGLNDTLGSPGSVHRMHSGLVVGQISDEGIECFLAAPGAGAANGMKVEPGDDLGDNISILALTDNSSKSETAKSLCIPDNPEHSLVQDGDDDFLVFFQSTHDVLLLKNRFTDQT